MSINYLDVTKRVNESLALKAEKEKELFSVPIEELMDGIEPVNPLVYYHRLIAQLVPNSQFAEYINNHHDDIVNIGRTIMTDRNRIIKEAIDANIGSNSIELFPGAVFNDVFDTLKRNAKGHGIAATGFTRDKCFLIAFVFNLTYEQTEYLLMHCSGEEGFNFKNPYEVLIAYCLNIHTDTFERYCMLKKKFEEANSTSTDKTHEVTYAYQLEFAKINNEDDLVDFVCTLPNTKRDSARKALEELYEYIDEIEKGFLDIELRNAEDAGIKLGKEFKATNCFSCEGILFGKDIHKKGKFDFIKTHSFTLSELKAKLNGTEAVSKQDIIMLCFLYYVISDGWSDLIEELEEKMSKGDNSFSIIQNIYEDFSCLCNEYLDIAGFSSMYLPDPLERTIVFCLMTTDPLATFRMIIAA